MNSKVEPESPCIRNCCLDAENICMGCYRSLDEITAWSTASVKKKIQYLQQAKIRRQSHKT